MENGLECQDFELKPELNQQLVELLEYTSDMEGVGVTIRAAELCRSLRRE